VSSLSNAPVSVLVPFASAAHTSARFVMLFDPGGRMQPRIGPRTGWIVMKELSGTANCFFSFDRTEQEH
jgi:hypothetical protein